MEKVIDNKVLKGAEANLCTFREKPVSEGIQICFRILYNYLLLDQY